MMMIPNTFTQRGVLLVDPRSGPTSVSPCACCLRCPYGVMPCGLYTASVVATSNTSSAAPASATSWILSPRRSPLDNVVSAATFARWLVGCICNSKTMEAKMFIRNFTRIQQCRNKPHLVPSDWTSPVSSEARLNGTMTNQPINSIARQAARTI